MDLPEFRLIFKSLTGNDPFPWQEALFEKFIQKDIPSCCDLPTGLGKTSVVAVWLIALALHPETVPRRLVYVVNRRTVVDQTTDEVEKYRKNLAAAGLEEKLKSLCAIQNPKVSSLALSTLRGQFADKGDWLHDPTRPAIIVGTVDMIGSRLLFNGYGRLGRYSKSSQAGLLAQDTLVLLDEAHLCPAFDKTLQAMERQLHRKPAIRPFHVLNLSATLADKISLASSKVFPLDKERDLKPNSIVYQRVTSKKTLRFIPESKDTEIPKKMATEAIRLGSHNQAVVIFCNSIDWVEKVAKEIKATDPKKKTWDNQIFRLTGEIRGKERDDLMDDTKGNLVFKHFRANRKTRSTAVPLFFIVTATAEVGVNFDADHAVCDLVSLERMIQRLGRINRFGEGDATISILHLPPKENQDNLDLEERAKKITLELLQKLPPKHNGFDASPEALGLLKDETAYGQGFTPAPACPPLDEARLDDWSMTSLSGKDYPRPQVSYWLNGLTPDDSVRIGMAWRKDLVYAQSTEEAVKMAETLPLHPREIAQVSRKRCSEVLGALMEKYPQAWMAIADSSGEWRAQQLSDLDMDINKRTVDLFNATIILPTNAGGLDSQGLPDKSAVDPVEDAVNPAEFERLLFSYHNDVWRISPLLESSRIEPDKKVFPTFREALISLNCNLKNDYKFIGLSRDPDDSEESLSSYSPHQTCIAYVAFLGSDETGTDLDLSALARVDVTLQKHTDDITAIARQVTQQLQLTPDLADAVVLVCTWHDAGKKNLQWQKAIGNRSQLFLAKSKQSWFDQDCTKGYRHEFGSLIEASEDESLRSHPQRDLVLHLIAAHHGYSRPGFDPKAYAILPIQRAAQEIAREAELRFARLQGEYGWWQLAYLEALVKCADGLASAQSQPENPGTP